MYTVEFDAKISNGTIKIPNKYISRLGDKVKVIILAGESDEKKEVSGFNSIRINTKGFKFDREDANER
jgi:hypothetical protein